MKKLYIVKAGTTFPATLAKLGDFDDWTASALGQTHMPIEVIDVESMGELPEPEFCAGVTVTGSHAMVTDKLDWSVRLEEWIADLVRGEVPFLGVCYGHQLLASATSGVVDYHPDGKEIGTTTIRCLGAAGNDPLFRDMPTTFAVHTTHSQSALHLPPDAVRLAENDYEPNHAFRIGTCAWGVQFHPEYDAAIMTSYIEEQADDLSRAGHKVATLLAGVTETPRAAELYRRFALYVDAFGQG